MLLSRMQAVSPGACSLARPSSLLFPLLSVSSSALVRRSLYVFTWRYYSKGRPPNPESPCWLMKKSRYPDAYRSLIRLRHSSLQAARDLYYIHVQLVEESKIIRANTYITRLTELFTIPRVRRATLASFVVMIAQQVRFLFLC